MGNIFPMTGQAALIPWTLNNLVQQNKIQTLNRLRPFLYHYQRGTPFLISIKEAKTVPVLKRLYGMLWVHLQPPAPITNFGPCHAWYWTSTCNTCSELFVFNMKSYTLAYCTMYTVPILQMRQLHSPKTSANFTTTRNRCFEEDLLLTWSSKFVCWSFTTRLWFFFISSSQVQQKYIITFYLN